jgi:hypothetical protein
VVAGGDDHRGVDRAQDVGDLVVGEAGVERDVDAAGPPHAEQRGDELGTVGQHHADGLAPLDAGGRQRGGDRIGAGTDLVPRVRLRAVRSRVDHRRRALGVGAGREQQVRQRHAPVSP